jgi:hypothetical protein
MLVRTPNIKPHGAAGSTAAASAEAFDSRRRSFSDAIRLLHVLLVASLIVPAAIFALAAWYDWQEIRDQALQQSTRTVQILREHALKVFESHEFAIDQIEERIQGLDWAAIRASEEVHRYIARLARRQHLLTGVALIAPDGRAASVSTAYPTPEPGFPR